MKDIRSNMRIMFWIVLLYMGNKFFLRPYVLKNEFPEFLDIFVLSFPNLCEAIVGALLITNISLYIKHKFLKTQAYIKESQLYIFAVLATAIYVLFQELKIHNLGGNNVYDPFDMLFSILGLIIVYSILLYTKPMISVE